MSTTSSLRVAVRYATSRAPLLLNYNPQLTFEDEAARPSQANRAARLCHAAGRFLLTLEAGEALDPDAAHTERRYFTRRGPVDRRACSSRTSSTQSQRCRRRRSGAKQCG